MPTEPIDSVGRIFQNPRDKREIWINVGRYEEHHAACNCGSYPRIYPEYDERLSLYLSKQTYNNLIEFMKENVDNSPCLSYGCSQMICVCTWGVCFCPFLYMHFEYKSLKKRMVDAFKAQNITKEVEVSLRIVDEVDISEGSSVSPVVWVDSYGQPLVFERRGRNRMRITFPPEFPPGVNMVLKLPGEIPWSLYPANPSAPQFPAIVDQPSSYPLLPQGYSSPQYATEQHNYCGKCGTKTTGSNFCTSCGACI